MRNWDRLDDILQVLEAMDDDELLAEQAKLRRQEGTEAEDETASLKLYNTYYVALDRASRYLNHLYGLPHDEFFHDEEREYEIAVPAAEAEQLLKRIDKLFREVPTQEICQSDYPLAWFLYNESEDD